ncbi:hypothetical protein GKZ68_00355 [Hymenobacter sp. BRD128]|uniref:hypothetical protein n=1 Tax=Hymenobacter sp. BRD128 TaxID=2675878 RepID=UPI001566DDA5|nr:hypothetical protein [Hymenobacter sp. BRD128]QKG55223.1 hypothetical protein GKZ68_00355 [Hymenobacter sp. BRD128]
MDLPLILAVAISMVFLYLLGSQVVLSIYELWAGYTNARGKFLYRRLKGVLGSNTTGQFYSQPAIAKLSPADQAPPSEQTGWKASLEVDYTNAWDWWRGADGLPSYVPADLFAATLLGMVAPHATELTDIMLPLAAARAQQLALTVGTLGGQAASPNQGGAQQVGTPPVWYSGELSDLLSNLFAGLAATATLAQCEQAVANWFDAYGERMTGWYKRQTRGWLFLIGLVVAIASNIDSPFIIRYLWAHPELSQHIADVGAKETQIPGAVNTYGKGIKAHFMKGVGKDSAASAVTIAITKSARAAVDSVNKKLLASEEQLNALNGRLRVLGFPIGRDVTTSQDSTQSELPTVFYIRQPAHMLHKGRTLENVPEYYVRYTRRLDKAKSSVPGITTASFYWQRENVLPTDTNKVKGPIRSNFQAWYAPVIGPPFFGPQSQSQPWWHTLLGWVLTAAALSVGAPFWFDLLCRLVNIRNLGIKPPRTEQE